MIDLTKYNLKENDIVYVDLADNESITSKNVKCRYINGIFQNVLNYQVYGSSVVNIRRKLKVVDYEKF